MERSVEVDWLGPRRSPEPFDQQWNDLLGGRNFVTTAELEHRLALPDAPTVGPAVGGDFDAPLLDRRESKCRQRLQPTAGQCRS